MMEIKFRGKRVDNREWAVSRCHLGTMANGTVIHDFDPATVGQYTGLKDKNGVEVFKGDIIQSVLLPTRRIKRNWLVFWDNDNYCFSIRDLESGKKTFLFEIRSASYEIEVIGNIFDNKELFLGKTWMGSR